MTSVLTNERVANGPEAVGAATKDSNQLSEFDNYHGDDVGDAVAAVDDDPRQRAVAHLARGPRRGQRQHGLHGDVQARHVE